MTLRTNDNDALLTGSSKIGLVWKKMRAAPPQDHRSCSGEIAFVHQVFSGWVLCARSQCKVAQSLSGPNLKIGGRDRMK